MDDDIQNHKEYITDFGEFFCLHVMSWLLERPDEGIVFLKFQLWYFSTFFFHVNLCTEAKHVYFEIPWDLVVK